MNIRLAGLGARAPLGTTPLQISMAARARLLVPRTLAWRDSRGRYVGACTAVGIDPHLTGYDRMLALAAPAAWQATDGVEDPVPLLLALPEAGRPDDDPRYDGAVLADLAGAAALALDLERSRVFRGGHAAGAMALARAAAMLGEPNPPEAVLVGGVDSWIHPALLRWLDEELRLHAIDVDDGFIPSEAAAFLLLRSDLEADAVMLHAAAAAREETLLCSDPMRGEEPNIGAAMTALVHGTSAKLLEPICWVLSDVNGERHRTSEWSKVAIRTFPAAEHLRLPDVLGDVGAATGPMAAVMVATYLRSGCAPAGQALIALHSDGPDRGAIVLETL